jgi:D-arabinose 1-dehydrogenase-like Zn-dependent alcohol dehydrogenase
MAKMKAAQITKAGGDFEIVEREIPQPGPERVRIRVQACGVCHSEVFVKEGGWPGLEYPRVPGHEIAGVIDAVGSGVTQWKTGQRVGVGWHGGQDGTCLACRRGDFGNCERLKVTGISYDGGYQEYMVAPVEAVARMPESLDAAEAAPLLCAGVTTFNALRHSGALPSDLVAVQGIGGLGHLGVQFAHKFGYEVAAIGRGPSGAALAKKLGAHVYIDSAATDSAAELQKRGGARAIVATAPSGKAMSSLIDGLGPNGHADGGGRNHGTDPRGPEPVDHQHAPPPWLGIGRSSRFGRYAQVCRADGRPPDDRALSAREGGGGLRAHDERSGRVPRGADDGALTPSRPERARGTSSDWSRAAPAWSPDDE